MREPLQPQHTLPMIGLSTCGPQPLWASVDNSDPTLIPTLGLGQRLQPVESAGPA